MPIPTKDEFRAEFHKLDAEANALEVALAPARQAYEAAREAERQFYLANVKPYEDAMRPIADQLHAINMQKGEIVRYLRDSKGVAFTGSAADFA